MQMLKTWHAATFVAVVWCFGHSLVAASAQSRPAPVSAPAGGLSAEAEQMRKQHVEAADKKLRQQNAAADRALGSLCAGCGTQPTKMKVDRRVRQARPLRPEEAPDYEWVPPVDDVE